MKNILIVVLLAVVVKGDLLSDATYFYDSVKAAEAQIAVTPIDWAAAIVGPPNIHLLIKVVCAKVDSQVFVEVPLNDTNVQEKFNFLNFPTIFMIHGWISNTSEAWATDFKNNWAASGRRGNLCFIDWRAVAYDDIITVAVINQRVTGNYLANVYLPWLNRNGLNYNDIILLGHSMGGQMAGIIGHAVKINNNTIPFIIGMDPAGPLFQNIPSEYRLSSDDATYVQIIHTCSGEYGYAGPCGDADFYINSGFAPQPQCTYLTPDDELTIHCSHARALELIIDSLLYPTQYDCLGIRCIPLQYILRLCIVTDMFGLDSARKPGEFYTSTGTSTTCTGDFYP